MNNQRFLDKVADVIMSRSSEELMETVVVFPNKRPEIFLKKYLREKSGGGFWIPDIRSIEEFVVELSPITPQDPMLTWFELYEIHKSIEGNKAYPPDEFVNIAPTMLNDFNDADLALADIKELFTFLSKAKALERWHPDGGELTDFEKSYLDFYQKLLQYYTRLRQSLSAKQMGTKGMVYRSVAETIEASGDLPWKYIIFTGFNALTPAEEKLIAQLRRKLPVTLLWDADEYYIKPGRHNLPWQEAGRYLNKFFTSFKLTRPQWIDDNLTTKPKEIRMVAAPRQISQAKFTGQLLEEWKGGDSSFSPTDTAIVLADENLLIPLLSSLPSGVMAYNVTMGYPLSLSPMAQFASLWIDVLVRRAERKNKAVNVSMVMSLLQNTVLRFLLKNPDDIVASLTGLNTAFTDLNKLELLFTRQNKAVFEVLFKVDDKPASVFNHLMMFLNLYRESIGNTAENNTTMLQQQVAAMLPVLKKMNAIIKDNEKHINLKALHRIFSRLVAGSEISLKGEPLDGVQIMGMLETRLLDFKKLIVLSANEGHLPKNSMSESFIPMDIRREYNLPLPDEKNAIYAYYFFRLLQRAQEVVLVYNSEMSDLGGEEKSRFLIQLEVEAAKANPGLHITQQFLKVEANENPADAGITIPKNEASLQRLEEIAKKGFSPSALNNYIDCSLKFYFSRILKLRPPEDLRTEIEADVFGTIIHQVLEEIYLPDKGKTIDADRLGNELNKLDLYLEKSLKQNYRTGDLQHGKNLLVVQVIRKYIERFVRKDMEALKQEPRMLMGTEINLEYPFSFAQGREVLIRGQIDRVDKKGNTIRISDYKTGDVRNVNFKEWDDLLTESKYSKAFQTLAYGWLYKQNHPQVNDIEVGLFSLRSISAGFIKPKLPKETSDEWLDDFESVLAQLMEDIFNVEKPFCQTSETDHCQYCDYKGICNR